MTIRQQKLLHAIIDEFIETADAVGSVNLAHKYNLGISPATIRNEMSDLVDLGYLEKPHTSSGRIPTNTGLKYFVDNLISDLTQLEVSLEAAMYEELYSTRFNSNSLVYKALQLLSGKTNDLAFVVTDNNIYYSGLSNLTQHPEYHNVEELHSLLNLVENKNYLLRIFSKYKGDSTIKFIMGEENDFFHINKSAIIFADISLNRASNGYLALAGPNRMDYENILPIFAFVANSLNNLYLDW